MGNRGDLVVLVPRRKEEPFMSLQSKVSSKIRTLLIAALIVAPMFTLPTAQAQIAIGISVHVGPPVLPVYVQPPLPAPGFIWTPGYWAYGDAGYYWVPGVWVIPPSVGVLWTPGYWGFAGGRYGWHEGYWGPTVGFYGGINYGNGYFGSGFNGGRWEGGVFQHNTVIANVNRTVVHNTYEDRTVVKEVKAPNHAFNGKGGIKAEPSRAEVE